MPAVDTAELVERIWSRDATLWTGRDEAKWLGWLDEPRRMIERVGELEALAAETAGFAHVVLLGMGGSSLAPEVLRRTFAGDRLHVLDTTHPAAVRRLAEELDLEGTLFVVASKSGTTLETRCHLDFFWERVGRGDNFFTLGGDSLRATRLIEALRLRFAVTVPLRGFFAEPTVAALARAIAEQADTDLEEGVV